MRTVANIIKSESIQMCRTTVKQALPTVRVDQVSPFLLLHHFGPHQVAPAEEAFDVAPHPHRGFEPVTFLYQGGLRHKDSRSNEGILKAGDVQWMTAGRGIIHSERASKEFLETGGTIEGIQLWINLPQAKKMAEPGYQDIKVEQIPQWTENEGKVNMRLVAGEYNGLKGPARTFTPVLALQLDLAAEGKTFVEIPENYNAIAYILDGEVTLNENFSYKGETLLHFRNDGSGFSFKALEPTRILVLAGEPINEPLAQWGPYVMNTQTEILEAMRDYQMGKMGFYID